jgi:hypothetical protein
LSNDSIIKSWRMHFGADRGLFLLLMVPNVILSILYWRVNAEQPLTVSALIVDRLLQITVLIFPFSLLAVLFAPVPIAKAGAVIGSVCSTLLGGSASSSAWQAPGPIKFFPTILAVICLVIGLGLLGVLTHRALLTRWQRISVAGALLVLLPTIQFWHTTSFVPARLRTSMSVTNLVVQVQSHTAKELRGNLQFALQNGSEVGARVLASWSAWCFSTDTRVNIELNTLSNNKVRQCWAAPVLYGLTDVDGKTSFINHRAFSVPENFQYVQLLVKVFYARSDRLRLGEKLKIDSSKVAAECPRGHIATYPVLPEAKFSGLVQKERYLTLHSRTPQNLEGFSLTAKGEALCGSGSEDLANYFGVTWIESRQYDWLPVN